VFAVTEFNQGIPATASEMVTSNSTRGTDCLNNTQRQPTIFRENEA
jgi:hypothetical protein